MKKSTIVFAIIFGIAFGILVSVIGVTAINVVAANNATQEVSSETFDIESVVEDHVKDLSDRDKCWSNYEKVEINYVRCNKTGRVDSVDYTVYDAQGENLGGGRVDWSTLVQYAK